MSENNLPRHTTISRLGPSAADKALASKPWQSLDSLTDEPATKSGSVIPNTREEFMALRTDTSKRTPKPPTAVYVLDGTTRYPFIQLQSITTIAGPEKSRKSLLTCSITAAALTDEPVHDKLIGGLPEEIRRVLYVDSEQEKYYAETLVLNVEKIIDPELSKNNLFHYTLRGYNPDERLQFIEKALAVHPPVGLMILDNVADTVFDFNDQRESKNVLARLSRLSVQYGCAVLIVLHDNPNTGKTPPKMRGHLGTFAGQTSSCVISVKLLDEDTTRSMVEPRATRSKPFIPFAIYHDEDGLPAVDHEIELDHKAKTWRRPGRKESKSKLADYGNSDHKEHLQAIFNNARVKEMDAESLKKGIYAVYPEIAQKEAWAAPAKLVALGFLKDNGKKTTGLLYSLGDRIEKTSRPFNSVP